MDAQGLGASTVLNKLLDTLPCNAQAMNESGVLASVRVGWGGLCGNV